MTADRRHYAAETVDCPVCGAEAGERCSGTRTGIRCHQQRRAEASTRLATKIAVAFICHRDGGGATQTPYDHLADAEDAAWSVCDRRCEGHHTLAWGDNGRVRVRDIRIRVPTRNLPPPPPRRMPKPPTPAEAALKKSKLRARTAERLDVAGRHDLAEAVRHGELTPKTALRRLKAAQSQPEGEPQHD